MLCVVLDAMEAQDPPIGGFDIVLVDDEFFFWEELLEVEDAGALVLAVVELRFLLH